MDFRLKNELFAFLPKKESFKDLLNDSQQSKCPHVIKKGVIAMLLVM